jgi:flagellar hook-length control protein FliK
MNPNSILARETRLPAQAARRQQATRADFQLPEPATDAPDRRAPAARDRDDRTATRIDRSRPELPSETQGLRGEASRGSDRSREVRRDGEAHEDRPERGEGPERRSARADEVSNRDRVNDDKVRQTDADPAGAAQEDGATPSPEQPIAAEATALDLLAKAEVGATTGETARLPDDMTASIDAPPPGDQSSGDGTPPLAGATATPQPLATPVAPAPVEAKPETSTAQAEPEAIIGQDGQKPARSAAALHLKGVGLKDAATDQTASSEDAADPAKAQDQPDASGKAPAEASHTALRPAPEAKSDPAQGQFQPAANRLETLPPGLAALPDNARALQAQLSEARPQTGAQPHSARGAESAPTSLSALPIEIGFRALEGTKRFDIRLDPAELGRVDVSLSFDKDGEVTAKLTVDRVETLHLLQRDAKTLERAFDQAGLRTSDAGVQITLSDRNAGNGGGFQAEQERARGSGRREDGEQTSAPITEIIPQRRLRLGGVDLNI